MDKSEKERLLKLLERMASKQIKPVGGEVVQYSFDKGWYRGYLQAVEVMKGHIEDDDHLCDEYFK